MINKDRTVYIFIVTIAIFWIVSSQSIAQSLYGNFPYYQSFLTSVQPTEIEKITPQGGKNNAATFTTNGLQLTPASLQQFGAVFIKDRQFQSEQGIRIEFEYAMYGGTGADGMSVFFFDASVQNPTIGAAGSGIGYSYNRANERYRSLRASGLSGAYLGVALDSYGNFKQRRWQGDARISGIPGLYTGNKQISNVTLRGAKGGDQQLRDFYNVRGMGDGYNGYPVLISQPTIGNNQGWILNGTGGTYSSINTYQGDFSLRGGSISTYRKAIIEIFPFTDNSGFWITVKIQHDDNTTTVINDYPYKKSIVYAENAYTSSGDYNTSNPSSPSSKTTILNATIPKYLRIGFAASTGQLTDIHLLRELRITLPGSAESYDDYASTPKGVAVDIDVLNNDIGYSGLVSKNQKGSKDYINPSAFRFCDNNGASLGTVDSKGTSYATADGLWYFNFVTRIMKFTPSVNFIGQASVKYNIKAGLNNEMPYNDEAYRSIASTVKVDVVPPKGVISNRMVTPVITPQ